ncbi:hypothetical protein [Actinomadura sp. SCN-SB]|uniref:hypothetical protein n=1 Tax=Actinomadura sp. SCN-SB TaxID=3373092 RepID=UPI003752800A
MPEREPDVEISASARADELVVHEKPEIEENTHTSPDGDSEIRTERTNLPGSTEPGTVYRDIRIDHRLAARLKDEGD